MNHKTALIFHTVFDSGHPKAWIVWSLFAFTVIAHVHNMLAAAEFDSHKE